MAGLRNSGGMPADAELGALVDLGLELAHSKVIQAQSVANETNRTAYLVIHNRRLTVTTHLATGRLIEIFRPTKQSCQK